MMNIMRTFSISSKVCCNSALSMSENSEFAISTEDGIQVLDLCQCPAHYSDQVSFTVTRIMTYDKPYVLKVSIQKSDIKKEMEYYADELSMKMLYDRALNPPTDGSRSRRGYTRVSWSPPGMDQVNRSILVTLTLDHRLSIYSRNHKKLSWIEIVRLSDLLNEHMKAYGYYIREEPSEDQATLYAHQIYSVTTTAFAWSHIIYDSPETEGTSQSPQYGRLATSTKNGLVVLWRIDVPATSSGVQIESVVPLPESVIVSSMCWCSHGIKQGYLAMGCVNGKIYTISLENCSVTELWTDPDHIRVTNIIWLEKCDLLVASKGTYLVIMKGGNESTVQSAGVHCVSNKLPLSGLVVSGDDSLVVSTIDGNLLQGHVTQGTQSTAPSISLSSLNLKKTSAAHLRMKCHGLAVSKNSMFCAILESPSEIYCHLRLKDPLKFHIVNMATPSQVLDLLLGSSSSEGSLYPFSDALITLKYHNYVIQSWTEIENFVQQVTARLPTQQASLFQLKLLRYILKMRLQACLKSATEEKGDTDTMYRQVNEAIMVQYLNCSLSQFIQSEHRPHSALEIQSAHLSCEMLRKFNSDMKESMELVHKVEELIAAKCTPQVCPICKCCLTEKKLSSATCQNGHEFARCRQTLLLCHYVPYRMCIWCNEPCINKTQGQDSPWLETLLTNYCVFCDQHLVQCQ